MQYAEQPTPPFNSPYQTHVSRTDSLLQPPYLSPSRHESLTKYAHGLGLYNYQHQVHTSLPPSPSPSDSWSSHVSSGASPLITQAIADPYASGAFEHPIIRSPQPWEGAQISPRSSVSPAAVMPLYSHTGSDNTYQEMNQGLGVVNLEGHSWPQTARYAQIESTLPSVHHHPLTVAPERLSSTTLPYGHAYSSTQATAPRTNDSHHDYVRDSRDKTISVRAEFPQASAHPVHRHPVRKRQASSPVIYCEFVQRGERCGKGFARNYNYKKHLETHVEDRPKPHVCYYADCLKGFVRKTDLDRHHKSVHLKAKDEKCSKCPAVFARKDTRRRLVRVSLEIDCQMLINR